MERILSMTKRSSTNATKNGLKSTAPVSRNSPITWPLKSRNMINQKEINRFVTAVETKKKFRRDPNMIFRHMISEMGELDGAMYDLERHHAMSPGGEGFFAAIGYELVDVIFLACYMADIYGVDLNTIIPGRMQSIAKEYKVSW